MIEMLTGVLRRKETGHAVLDVGGVGFAVAIPLQTFDQLPECGGQVTLVTHLNVREDALQLFGFSTEQERVMFRLLLGITGIGPKLALNILSGSGVERLRTLVTSGNLGALTAIPGIGRKTAERIIVELRDTLRTTAALEPAEVVEGEEGARSEAILALLALGYARSAAEKVIQKVFRNQKAPPNSVSDIIRQALQELNS